MASPFAAAWDSTIGLSAAACCGVRFAWEEKAGSVVPRRNFEPEGIAALSDAFPQTIGSNSMPASSPLP